MTPGLWPLRATSLSSVVLSPGCHRGQRRRRSWRQSGPGHLSCPLGQTCAAGARRRQRLGRSSGECSPARARHPQPAPAGHAARRPADRLSLLLPGVCSPRRSGVRCRESRQGRPPVPPLSGPAAAPGRLVLTAASAGAGLYGELLGSRSHRVPAPGLGQAGALGAGGRVPAVPPPCSGTARPAGPPPSTTQHPTALRVRPACRSDSEHRFWKPCEVDPEGDSAAVSELLRSRRITFAGRFEPVQHRCRAPRPDGRLCERQDRLKVGWGPGRGGCWDPPRAGVWEPDSRRIGVPCAVPAPGWPGSCRGGLGRPAGLRPSRRAPPLRVCDWRVGRMGNPPERAEPGSPQPRQDCLSGAAVPFPREDHPERRCGAAPPPRGPGPGAEAAAAEAG